MSFLTTLLEQYSIMESLDSVIKSNPNIPEQTIRDYHQHALPDGNKSDKLLNHVLKLHKSGEITLDRASELKPHLTALHLANQLNKISSLKTLGDHINATSGMNTNTKKENIDANTKILPSSDNIILKQHLNHESAIKGAMLHPENPIRLENKGKVKAQWCLSVDDKNGLGHFNRYTENGMHPLYTVFNKDTKRSSAFVADPNMTKAKLEIRDENDDRIIPHRLLLNTPGLEHTVVGDFLKQHHPEEVEKYKKIIKIIPYNSSNTDLDKFINHKTKFIRLAAINHHNINETNLNNALDSVHDDVRIEAMLHPKVNEEHIIKALKDPNQEVRGNAVRNNKITKQQLTDALDDPHGLVHYYAIRNNNIDTSHITKVLNDNKNAGSFITKMEALKHDIVTEHHINTALKDDYSGVREMAVMHSNATKDNLINAINGSDHKVAAIAQKILNKKFAT